MNGLTLRDLAFVNVIGGTGISQGVPFDFNDHLIVDYNGSQPWDIDVTSPNGSYSYTATSPNRYAYVSAINCPLLTSLTVNGTANSTQTMSYCNTSGSTKLQTLIVPNNNISSLDVSTNISMSYLDFRSGSITDFTSSRSITTLICPKGRLSKLNLTASVSMSQVTCSFNSLTSLDVSGLKLLSGMDASYNNFTSFTAPNTTTLKNLYLNNNSSLSSITFYPGLVNLNIASCGFTSWNSSGATLKSLNISSNAITSLNVFAMASLSLLYLTNCTSLTSINCSNCTSLTSLNLATLSALNSFQGSLAGLTSVDVSGNPLLSYLQFDGCTSCTSLTGLTDGNLIQQLYIDNSPVGDIDLSTQTSLTYVHVTNCGMTNLDVSAAQGALSQLWAYDNTGLTSINVGSALSLSDLTAYNCALSRASIDAILSALNSAGNSNGTVDLSGGSSDSPTFGIDNPDKLDLEGRGWTVNVNDCTPVGYDVPGNVSAALNGDILSVSWNNIGYDTAPVQVYVAYDNKTYDVNAGDTSVDLGGYTDATGEVWVRLGDGCGNWSDWAVTTIV